MGQKSSKLSASQLAGLASTTYFNKRELQRWHKDFLKSYPSGGLDEDSFKQIYKQYFPFGDPTLFAEYIFKVYDTNRNGIIDFEEYIYALSITSRGKTDERLDWAFQLYDINKDGVVTYEEMLGIVHAIYKMVGKLVRLPDDVNTPEKRVDKIFATMDLDHDGVLTMEEFKNGSKMDPSIMHALSLYEGVV
ncbi:EF-hand [Basidiobolus meristosporus CBS 931.73]|uniref:Calcium-binding protein NCS-1 n=1 Tax=Basidiobolus meristosporus CBS 931.73 TaxID=1314790 RepID=A0A1Y1YC57_9FUNG|nr:EF-hand [Basidiobolus meristosporus CBS 931.73]|eukprot:ORX95641.1 EF-hand [Basidiobolus meristosporus CBS 931.73]